jgi:hypothetical protein
LNIYFGDQNFYKLEREDGLLFVTLPIFYAGSPPTGTMIRFTLDTGAYMSVISRGTAVRRGLDKLPKKSAVLFGFGGGIDVDFVRIPGIKILGRLRTDVPVLIPHDTYRIHPRTGQRKQMPEVLGLNVLEYYNYYIDSENDRLYLSENGNPRFYNPEIKSGQVFLVDNAQNV